MRHMGAMGGAGRTLVLEWGLLELCGFGGLGRRGACEAGARNLTLELLQARALWMRRGIQV